MKGTIEMGLVGQWINGSVSPPWSVAATILASGLVGLPLPCPHGDIQASITCHGGILAQVEWYAWPKGRGYLMGLLGQWEWCPPQCWRSLC